MVTLSKSNHSAIITIDRPEKLNALTIEMLYQFEKHIANLEQDSDIRVVLVTGGGDRSFCVGADINAWAEATAIDMWRNWIREGHRIFDRLAAINIPTIAVLNGYTLGGGLEIALACDIRIAADDITLALPEVKLGIIPGWAGTQRLPAVIGPARAKQMIFTGERVTAQKAEQWGLINESVPRESMMDRAHEVAKTIIENAPLAVQMTKQIIDGGFGHNTGYRLEALASAFARYTDDAKEGVASFREKRTASFTGR
ncbi:MAG: enoyl-CoA hydratase/isomerase family protein [Rhodothermaceae bacterium]|nr:enoyl-CoA hydratase/isomerase family protein [Rhodothermaceae bacterium]